MRYMTDKELIDYTLKFDTDPTRIRLAKIMDNMPGAILDDLEQAGMDPVFCNFENTYLPGQYIRHLESEIEYLNRELSDTQEKLAERETLSVSELINELRDIAVSANRRTEVYVNERNLAVKQREEMKEKLDMWAILNR
jgi:hypothetical protein